MLFSLESAPLRICPTLSASKRAPRTTTSRSSVFPSIPPPPTVLERASDLLVSVKALDVSRFTEDTTCLLVSSPFAFRGDDRRGYRRRGSFAEAFIDLHVAITADVNPFRSWAKIVDCGDV